MKKVPCLWLAFLFSGLVWFALPERTMTGSAGFADNAFPGESNPDMSSRDPHSSAAICYASPHGNDTADGLTFRSAKQDVMSCYDAIPGGTIVMLDGGHGVPLRACPRVDPAGCGIWIMGSTDPNYAHPPAGWRKEKAISFVGGMRTGDEALGHDYQTHIAAGGSDSKHPGIWLSSTFQITFENIFITSCLPALVGTDSNRNPANGQSWDNVFDNVGFWATKSVGCGPGIFISSSSSRNFIRHSQVQGSTSEHALAATISRQSNIVTFTANAKLPASWKTGMVVGVEGVRDPDFDGGDFTITLIGAKTFTYPQIGPEATSSGGRAASDGNQAIVMNPHGAQGNSLSADDLHLYDGAMKVYAGTSRTNLDVAKVDQEGGFGPAIWIATCNSSMVVNAQDIRTAKRDLDGIFASVRSDCTKSAQDLASRPHVQYASVEGPARFFGGEDPSRTIANPPLRSQRGNLKSGLTKQTKAFAVQVGAFRDPANADLVRARVGATYGPVVITRSDQSNHPFYRVCVGHESSPSAARELGEKLRSANLAAGTMVVRVN